MKITQLAILAISSASAQEVAANPELARASKLADSPRDGKTEGSAFAELCGQKAFALRIDRIQPWKVVSKLVVAWDGVIHAVPVQTVAMGWFVSSRTVVLHIVARSALTASQNGTIAGEMRNVAVG